jgi:putative intracellular protease/amidase
MKLLIVLTSHSDLGKTGQKTGFWIEEFAAPFYVFQDAGVEITLASPKGGQPPVDPKSAEPVNQTDATRRFDADKDLQELLANTKVLAEVSADDYDAVFYPGGHGPLWDLANNKDSIKLIKAFWNSEKPVAAVCHAPAVLLNVYDDNGDSIIKGKNVTGFSNSEEEAVQLTKIVPFLLEDELGNNGAIYSKKEDWAQYVVKDGLLVTGQNPASSAEVARQLLALLEMPYPDYPVYPVGEDIYQMAKQEVDLNPEEISKHKQPNEKNGKLNEKDFKTDAAGNDLDVPGSELDDEDEMTGNEDEENNHYSLGGDNHNDLEEDKGE